MSCVLMTVFLNNGHLLRALCYFALCVHILAAEAPLDTCHPQSQDGGQTVKEVSGTSNASGAHASYIARTLDSTPIYAEQINA